MNQALFLLVFLSNFSILFAEGNIDQIPEINPDPPKIENQYISDIFPSIYLLNFERPIKQLIYNRPSTDPTVTKIFYINDLQLITFSQFTFEQSDGPLVITKEYSYDDLMIEEIVEHDADITWETCYQYNDAGELLNVGKFRDGELFDFYDFLPGSNNLSFFQSRNTGKEWHFQYNDQGNPEAYTIFPQDSEQEDEILLFEYEDGKLVKLHSDNKSDFNLYHYDPAGNLYKIEEYRDDQLESHQVFNTHGEIIEILDPSEEWDGNLQTDEWLGVERYEYEQNQLVREEVYANLNSPLPEKIVDHLIFDISESDNITTDNLRNNAVLPTMDHRNFTYEAKILFLDQGLPVEYRIIHNTDEFRWIINYENQGNTIDILIFNVSNQDYTSIDLSKEQPIEAFSLIFH